MSENFRAESRRDWHVPGIGTQPSDQQLAVGCLQRIADATELMAKNYQGLINERDQARKSRDYWQAEQERMARRLIAARGQITKLKKQLEARNAE